MDTSQTASGRAASVHVRDLSVAFGALPVLDKLNLDGFVAGSPRMYQNVAEMMRVLGDS